MAFLRSVYSFLEQSPDALFWMVCPNFDVMSFVSLTELTFNALVKLFIISWWVLFYSLLGNKTDFWPGGTRRAWSVRSRVLKSVLYFSNKFRQGPRTQHAQKRRFGAATWGSKMSGDIYCAISIFPAFVIYAQTSCVLFFHELIFNFGPFRESSDFCEQREAGYIGVGCSSSANQLTGLSKLCREEVQSDSFCPKTEF